VPMVLPNGCDYQPNHQTSLTVSYHSTFLESRTLDYFSPRHFTHLQVYSLIARFHLTPGNVQYID
jgi:hypothetical protein